MRDRRASSAIEAILLRERPMMTPDPILGDPPQFQGFADDFLRVGVGHNECAIVINFVSLAAAQIEIPPIRFDRGADCQGQRFERGDVVAAAFRVEPIPGTGQNHFCHQQRGSVSGRKPRVGGNRSRRGIPKLDLDGLAELVEFRFACSVWLDPIRRHQLLPGHRAFQPRTVWKGP